MERHPDLFVLGLSAGGIAANGMLESLARMKFDGKVLLFGPRASPMVTAILQCRRGSSASTCCRCCRHRSATTTCATESDLAVADRSAAEPAGRRRRGAAFQIGSNFGTSRKSKSRTLTMSGAEALIRMRHPTWGIVPPAYFHAGRRRSTFPPLSEFVVSNADRRLALISSPTTAMSNSPSIFPSLSLNTRWRSRPWRRQMPKSSGLRRPDCRNRRQRPHSQSAAGEKGRAAASYSQHRHRDRRSRREWPLLMELDDFPFVEIKVDRKFVSGLRRRPAEAVGLPPHS